MLENLCCGLWRGEGGQDGGTNFKSCWLRGWLIMPHQLKQNPTQMHLCWSLWIYTGWLLKGGKVGLCKCWSIYYAWKLKQFLIVPLSIIKPVGLDAAPHLGMSPTRAWVAHPLHGSFFPPPLLAAQPGQQPGWSFDWPHMAAPFLSSSLTEPWDMLAVLHEVLRLFFFFFWWGQFPLVSKHLLKWSLNKCLVKRLVLW